MDTEQMQPQEEMTPDESKAALGLGNKLMQGLMPQAEMEEGEGMEEAPQEPETAPEQAEEPQPEEIAQTEPEAPQEENQEMQKITKDFDEFKGKMEGIIDTKFNDLTKTLTDALKED